MQVSSLICSRHPFFILMLKSKDTEQAVIKVQIIPLSFMHSNNCIKLIMHY